MNAALAAVSDLAIRRGLGRLDGGQVARLDLPARRAPKALVGREDIRWQRAAQAAPARDRAVAAVMLIAAHDGGEACVCDLTDPVGLSQPTVSHHLKQLVETGLVTREQRGKWAYYPRRPGRSGHPRRCSDRRPDRHPAPTSLDLSPEEPERAAVRPLGRRGHRAGVVTGRRCQGSASGLASGSRNGRSCGPGRGVKA